VKNLSNASTLCDIHDLLGNATLADLQNYDARTAGDRVVITDKLTGQDISVGLVDFEVAALLLRIETAFPDTRCSLHRPYDRRYRNRRFYDMFAECTCTKVFHSRLLARRVEALAAGLAQASDGLAEVAQAVRTQRRAS